MIDLARNNYLHSLTKYNDLASFLRQHYKEMEGKVEKLLLLLILIRKMKNKWKFILGILITIMIEIVWTANTPPPDLSNFLGEKIAEKDYVKATNITRYLERGNAPMPQDHIDVFEEKEEISAKLILKRGYINKLLDSGYFDVENGYCQLDERTVYVSVLTKIKV